jgi:hypothetical protein
MTSVPHTTDFISLVVYYSLHGPVTGDEKTRPSNAQDARTDE